MRRLASVTTLAVSVARGSLTWRQTAQYASADTLYRATIVRNPTCWLCYTNLGGLLLDGSPQQLREATTVLDQAVRLNPAVPEARLNLGIALLKEDRPAEAASQLREALALSPDYALAHQN